MFLPFIGSLEFRLETLFTFFIHLLVLSFAILFWYLSLLYLNIYISMNPSILRLRVIDYESAWTNFRCRRR